MHGQNGVSSVAAVKVRACLGLGKITIEHFRIGGYSKRKALRQGYGRVLESKGLFDAIY